MLCGVFCTTLIHGVSQYNHCAVDCTVKESVFSFWWGQNFFSLLLSRLTLMSDHAFVRSVLGAFSMRGQQLMYSTNHSPTSGIRNYKIAELYLHRSLIVVIVPLLFPFYPYEIFWLFLYILTFHWLYLHAAPSALFWELFTDCDVNNDKGHERYGYVDSICASFGKSQVRVLAQRPTILSVRFCGFPQPLQEILGFCSVIGPNHFFRHHSKFIACIPLGIWHYMTLQLWKGCEITNRYSNMPNCIPV